MSRFVGLPGHRLFGLARLRLVALACSLSVAACSTPVKSPLHVSFEELGYASEDVGSWLSNKYRSVVNIAGFAPLASVGSLHNRPQRYALINPLRYLINNNLPDYYSLALTTQCSKVLELIYDEGVTEKDVWTVRESLESLVGQAQTALIQRVRKKLALALADAHAKAVEAAAAVTADKLASPPENTPSIAEEMLLRSMALQILKLEYSTKVFEETLGLSAEQATAVVAPTKDNLAAYQAGVKLLNAALATRAGKMSEPSESDIALFSKAVTEATSTALRKGIFVTRWYAESTQKNNFGLGSIVKKQTEDGRLRQGFLVMGGIRLAQIILGNDFLEYRNFLKHTDTASIDKAVSDQFMVLYTVGAKHRAIFEETTSELLQNLQLNLDSSQVEKLLDFPTSTGAKNVLELIKQQSIVYQSALTALVNAGEQGFLPKPHVRIFEFRFNTPDTFEKSMLAEKVRSAGYGPIYSVRADVVQQYTHLIDDQRVTGGSPCKLGDDINVMDAQFDAPAPTKPATSGSPLIAPRTDTENKAFFFIQGMNPKPRADGTTPGTAPSTAPK